MHIGLNVKYSLFLSDVNEALIFSTGFLKMLIKRHENASSRSRVVAWEWTGGQRDRHDEANSRFS
jgi:hypothetical protein